MRKSVSCVPLEVGVGIPITSFRTGALTGVDVSVLVDPRVRRQPFKPHLVIVMQATRVVVEEHTRSNVHSRYKGQYPLYHIPLSYH